MNIATVIGARPQFIKAAVVSKNIRKNHKEIIIHTGQHYDKNMSDVFFSELGIPKPDYNLNINGKSHGEMTGQMLIELEKLFLNLSPDMVLVYGDTNSTLAASLAAVKLHIPVCHVEAGNRLNTLTNPEEINRVITDKVSTLLLCSVESSVENLKKEGLGSGITFVGDPMYDAFIQYSKKRNVKDIRLKGISGEEYNVPENYYYLTCHREENSEEQPLHNILASMEELDYPTIYPVHPRNTEKVKRIIAKYSIKNIIATEPIGYLDSISLVKNANKIVTDSGGVQREAFFAKVQCVTIFDYVVWPETMVKNRNQLAKPESKDILEKLSAEQVIDDNYQPFGDGSSAEKILSSIDDYFGKGK